MAWEQSKDFTSGYLTEWRDQGRWRAKIVQCGVGGHAWRWEVTKQRDTQGPRGEWWDTVAYRTEETSQAAHVWASLILRASVVTTGKANRLARQATAHGFFYADYRAAAYCPRCKVRVEHTVDVNRDRMTPSGRLRDLDKMALTQLREAIAAHLLESCEWMPDERMVKLILEGRTHASE